MMFTNPVSFLALETYPDNNATDGLTNDLEPDLTWIQP
jgi:hypothetical protein